MGLTAILELSYLLAAILFIVGLKFQSSPDTAKKGNLLAATGMLTAMFVTIVVLSVSAHPPAINFLFLGIALLAGGLTGRHLASTVKMTGMPEMVALLNGFGGACSFLLANIEFADIQSRLEAGGDIPQLFILISLSLGTIIGGITITGSIWAWGKLNGKVKDWSIPRQQILNMVVMAGIIASAVWLISNPAHGLTPMILLATLALVYGILFVMPIGGADMPVVIALLNSFSGVAGIFAGFLLDNQVMIISGILVGSSGTILSVLMCRAMNRSLLNVLVGNFGGGGSGVQAATGEFVHKEVGLTDAAIMLYYAEKVMIVPGYGMAVAQAQHAVHEIEKLLAANGVDVKYAIHPVAGRMPGHMNVLLAEADVSYDKLLEMDDANPEMNNTDVVLVIGANDVVNPAANEEPSSPIYGMPIINAHEAKNVIVLKRSMNPGYAGIENPLFFKPCTSMLFGDAKASIEKLAQEIKTL
jgi:H+-translocating NAD(P) transhydrogenase subunit beta